MPSSSERSPLSSQDQPVPMKEDQELHEEIPIVSLEFKIFFTVFAGSHYEIVADRSEALVCSTAHFDDIKRVR